MHTKEPWTYYPEENGLEWGIDAGEWGIAICAAAPGPSNETAEDNARRIVACVNACTGIPTNHIEDGSANILAYSINLHRQLADMTADRDSWEAQADARVKDCVMFIEQRDELLAALEKCVAQLDLVLPKNRGIGYSDVAAMKAAIARVKAQS